MSLYNGRSLDFETQSRSGRRVPVGALPLRSQRLCVLKFSHPIPTAVHGFLSVIFGSIKDIRALSSMSDENSFGTSSSWKIASVGHSATQASQSMQSSGLM